MNQELKSKNATVAKTQSQKTERVFNLQQVQSSVTEEGNILAEATLVRLSKQAEEMAITLRLARDMAGIILDESNDKENEELIDQLYNVYYKCQRQFIVFKNGNILCCRKCNTRYCLTCSRIRSAKCKKKYLPIIKTWIEPYFVKLTVMPVFGCELKDKIDSMYSEFSKAITLLNRKKGVVDVRYLGIKFFDCDFDERQQLYNPHFSLLVNSKETAELIIEQWLKQFPNAMVAADDQEMEAVKEGEADNIINFCTKHFADKKIKELLNTDDIPVLYLKAQMNIFKAMMGSRKQYSRFGFTLPKERKQKQRVEEHTEAISERLIFEDTINNFLNPDTGEIITDYEMPQKLEKLLSMTDTDLF